MGSINLDNQNARLEFLGRVFLNAVDQLVEYRNFWVHDFPPENVIDDVADWPRQYFDSSSFEDICDLFGVPQDKSQVVVFKAELRSWWTPDTPNGPPECEEEITINEAKFAPYDPERTAQALTEAVNLGLMFDSNSDSTFQVAVDNWVIYCMGDEIRNDVKERCFRLLEEVFELAQVLEMTQFECTSLMNYVFNRAPGSLRQELGGVMVTLAAMFNAFNLDMHTVGWEELRRAESMTEQIRVKNASKLHRSGTPLPGTGKKNGKSQTVSWRKIIDPVMQEWPEQQIRDHIASIAEDNDHAERMGFSCQLDDRRGAGYCLYMQDNVVVYAAGDAWCRTEATFNPHKEFLYFHTLGQALSNTNPFLLQDKFGEIKPPIAQNGK